MVLVPESPPPAAPKKPDKVWVEIRADQVRAGQTIRLTPTAAPDYIVSVRTRGGTVHFEAERHRFQRSVDTKLFTPKDEAPDAYQGTTEHNP